MIRSGQYKGQGILHGVQSYPYSDFYWNQCRWKAQLFQRKEWKLREQFIQSLLDNGWHVEEYDNCWRINAFKGGEEMSIDILEPSKGFDRWGHVGFPVQPIYEENGYTYSATTLRDSKYWPEFENIAKSIYPDFHR